MLQFNFTRLFNARGISKPTTYMIHQGFSDKFATRVVHNNFRKLNLDDVQRLCEIFICTPNDLLEWRPTKDIANASTHPLASLIRTEKIMDLTRTLNSIPLEKLLEIEKIIQSEIDK
jgi:DNA-binding Xre family transcriptional regulator